MSPFESFSFLLLKIVVINSFFLMAFNLLHSYVLTAKNRYVHGDIKPNNLLINSPGTSERKLFLVDIGLSNNSVSAHTCGIFCYLQYYF